jgi:hypothetical protein
VGSVIHGMDIAKQFYSYGDEPSQGKIKEGPEYIQENFPATDYFETCTVQRINQHQEQHEASSSSIRINPQRAHNHVDVALHDVHANTAEKLQFQDSSISLLLFSFANDGKWSRPLSCALVLIVILGLVMSMMIRSRRKTLNKTS